MSPYPAVTKAWDKATIKDDPVKQSNKRGFVTFAKTDRPNSRTSQLFINFADRNAFLDGSGFAPIGQVIEGMDVVDKIYSGYGEARSGGGRGPEQDAVENGGKAYLDKNFPLMDRILNTTITFPEAGAAAPPAAPKTAPKATPPAPKK
jgi:peptidyl-prolyl cis-trans isomerase A (cyclophilin A)